MMCSKWQTRRQDKSWWIWKRCFRHFFFVALELFLQDGGGGQCKPDQPLHHGWQQVFDRPGRPHPWPGCHQDVCGPGAQVHGRGNFFSVLLNFNTFSLAFNYTVGSSKRCVVINVHFIQKLVTYLKSSFQDELQEFFSEFGPVHQLNILRDKTSGVSRQEKCQFQRWSCVSCFSGGAVLSPTSAVEMPWRHKTDFTTSRSYPGWVKALVVQFNGMTPRPRPLSSSVFHSKLDKGALLGVQLFSSAFVEYPPSPPNSPSSPF